MKIYYSIKEVASLLKEPESTLRYWEDEFPEEIKPTRSERGVRQYKEEDIDNIRFIQYNIRDCRLTLDGVRKKLKNNKEGAIKQANVVMKLKNIKAELQALGKSMSEADKIPNK